MRPLDRNGQIALPAQQRSDLEELLAGTDLGEGGGAWLEQATVCVRLDLDQQRGEGPTGCSRYGGRPDLPVDLPWPSRAGNTYGFLQQINLAEVPAFEGNPLPRSGMLSFFLEDDQECGAGGGRYHVFHFPSSAGLETRDPPPELVAVFDEGARLEGYEDLQPFRLHPELAVDLPTNGRLFDRVCESLGDGWEALFALAKTAFGEVREEQIGGRLLGHPYGIQEDQILNATLMANGMTPNPYFCGGTLSEVASSLRRARAESNAFMVGQCESASVALAWLASPDAERQRRLWLPLWSVESNFRVGTCFWDAGSVSAYVLRAELAQGRVGDAYVELQSS